MIVDLPFYPLFFFCGDARSVPMFRCLPPFRPSFFGERRLTPPSGKASLRFALHQKRFMISDRRTCSQSTDHIVLPSHHVPCTKFPARATPSRSCLREVPFPPKTRSYPHQFLLIAHRSPACRSYSLFLFISPLFHSFFPPLRGFSSAPSFCAHHRGALQATGALAPPAGVPLFFPFSLY